MPAIVITPTRGTRACRHRASRLRFRTGVREPSLPADRSPETRKRRLLSTSARCRRRLRQVAPSSKISCTLSKRRCEPLSFNQPDFRSVPARKSAKLAPISIRCRGMPASRARFENRVVLMRPRGRMTLSAGFATGRASAHPFAGAAPGRRLVIRRDPSPAGAPASACR
jgi:hypothetical protein